jgi:hypothetical protein
LAGRSAGVPSSYSSLKVKLFSLSERIQAFAPAVSLVALGYGIRAVGVDESTEGGRVVLAIVGFPILFLMCYAVFGRVSRD